jgi:hypothetical protein
MRKFFCARSKKKGEIDVTLVSQKGKKKVKIPEILFSFGPRGDLFFLNKKRDKKRRKQRREEKQILFLKRIRYISSQITTLIIIIIIIFSFSLSLSLLSIYYFS